MAPTIPENLTIPIKLQSFVYTPLNDQTVLFLPIKFTISHLFAHSLNVKQFTPIDRILSFCYNSGPEWAWEQWQGRGTPNSPKLHDRSLTIRLFTVISRTHVGWVRLSYLSAEMQLAYFIVRAD